MTIKIPGGSHSSTGPSSAPRWMNCAGSLNLIKKLEVDVSAGMDAAYGTAAHEICAMCIRDGHEPWEFLGTEVEVEDRYKFTVDDEMVGNCQTFIDLVWQLYNSLDQASMRIEQHIQSGLHEDARGTPDVVIEAPGRMIIPDYKNGMVLVEPDSDQLRMYAALALETTEQDEWPDSVELYIVQPRAAHSQGPIRKHVENSQELYNWFETEVIPAIENTKDPNAPLVVGEWCRFCPARAHCPAIVSEFQYFNTDIEPVYLSDAELAELKQRYEVIRKYGEQYLNEELLKRLKNGHQINGWKLVEKQATRVFKDGAEDAAKEKWGEEVYSKPEFLGPAKVDKLPGGKQFTTQWAYKPKTGYTVASASDSRPEVKTLMDKLPDEAEDA